jgi:hypothetical protein
MRNRREAALKAWETIRNKAAWKKAHAAERASKRALRKYCEDHGWKLAFFEGETGAPRTGIIDAIAYKLGRDNPDRMDLRLIQLKGGRAGVSGEEIGRLKEAAGALKVDYLVAEFDGKRKTLEILSEGTLI